MLNQHRIIPSSGQQDKDSHGGIEPSITLQEEEHHIFVYVFYVCLYDGKKSHHHVAIIPKWNCWISSSTFSLGRITDYNRKVYIEGNLTFEHTFILDKWDLNSVLFTTPDQINIDVIVCKKKNNRNWCSEVLNFFYPASAINQKRIAFSWNLLPLHQTYLVKSHFRPEPKDRSNTILCFFQFGRLWKKALFCSATKKEQFQKLETTILP